MAIAAPSLQPKPAIGGTSAGDTTTPATGTGVEYLYPETWTSLTDAASNWGAGFPTYFNDVYNNWYSGPLSTGVTSNYQKAINAAMSNPQEWIQDIYGAQGTAGQGVNTLNQTIGAVNPYMTGINQFQTQAGNAMGGYNTALDYLGQVPGQMNKYLGEGQTSQGAGVNYNTQIGQGLGGVTAGLKTTAGALPYVSQAASQFLGSSEYDPAELQKYLNPYTQDAAKATVSELNRNLTENLMPGVNSTFAGAGQFGSSRNSEFASRAMRDTQEAAAKALAQANYGAYTDANKFYSDWANKGMQAGSGLGTLAGVQSGIGGQQGTLGTQQSNIINQQAQNMFQNAGLDQNQAQLASSVFQNLATTQGNLTSQQVSGYLQQAGIDQNQANLIAQMYPQIAGAYGSLAGQQGSLAGQGATLGQQNLTNMFTGAGAEQKLKQDALTASYNDWLQRQQFPMQGWNALTTGIGNMAKGVEPNVSSPIAQPDDVSKVLAVIQAASAGMNDDSMQGIIDYLFGENGAFSLKP